jgi:hypothetical protein
VVDKQDDLDKLAKAMTFAKKLVEEATKKMKDKSEEYGRGFALAVNFYVNLSAALATLDKDGYKGYKDGNKWVVDFSEKFWEVEKKDAAVSRKKSKQ